MQSHHATTYMLYRALWRHDLCNMHEVNDVSRPADLIDRVLDSFEALIRQIHSHDDLSRGLGRMHRAEW